MMNSTVDSLVPLFCSSGGGIRGYGADFRALSDSLQSGSIAVSEIEVPIPPRPSRDAKAWKRYYDAFTSNTSDSHGWLKWAAWNWLRGSGEFEPQYEQSYPGGKADVYAPTSEIAVECGDTSPDKLFAALRGGCAKWVLLPFPRDHRFYLNDTPVGQLVKAYEFSKCATRQ
jgi:hypothetical protein